MESIAWRASSIPRLKAGTNAGASADGVAEEPPNPEPPPAADVAGAEEDAEPPRAEDGTNTGIEPGERPERDGQDGLETGWPAAAGVWGAGRGGWPAAAPGVSAPVLAPSYTAAAVRRAVEPRMPPSGVAGRPEALACCWGAAAFRLGDQYLPAAADSLLELSDMGDGKKEG